MLIDAALAAGPDVTRSVNSNGQWVMTVANFTVMSVVVTACLFEGVVRRRWDAFVIVVLGGALACALEPLWDSAFHLWFFSPGQWSMGTTYGFELPVWVLPTYIWFYGGQAYIAYRLTAAGMPRKSSLALFGWVFGVATIFEIVGVNIGTYEYWGEQSFRVAGFPVWISALNAAVPVVTGVMLALARPHLTGPRVLAMAVLVPACDAMVMFGPTVPYLAVLNAENPSSLLLGAAALMAAAMAAVLVWVVSSVGAPIAARRVEQQATHVELSHLPKLPVHV